jgi:hypothetical protein
MYGVVGAEEGHSPIWEDSGEGTDHVWKGFLEEVTLTLPELRWPSLP